MKSILYHPGPNLLIAVAFASGMTMLGFQIGGVMAIPAFGIAFGGGLLAWLFTTFRHPVGADGLVIPTLLTVMIFIGHVAEEYYTEFYIDIAKLAGTEPSLDMFLGVAAFSAPIMWTGTIILLLLRHPLGNYMIWVFFIGMLLAELTHFLFPFIEDGTFHYFPGMYTAALPLIPAAFGFRRLLRNISAEKAARGGEDRPAPQH